MSFINLDQTFSSTIKHEKHDDHLEHYFKSNLTSTDSIDQPLLIVLDEDDGNLPEENSSLNTNLSNNNNDLCKLSSSTVDSSLIKSGSSSKFFRRSRKSRLLSSEQSNSNKFVGTLLIGTNFMRQTSTHRHKLHARRKNLSALNMSTNSNSKNLSLDNNSTVVTSNDSILSKISFDNISDILTISRMGSIFYCLEDLYMKVFASLCTLDELVDLLTKSDNYPIKQATLSEKISIEQQISSLKKYNDNRYRLISINSSECLHKLQQLLTKIGTFDENDEQRHQREKRLTQIIDEMRSYKKSPTLVLLKDKVSHSPMTTKRLSSDDEDDEEEEEPRERLKIVTKKQKLNESPPLPPTQFGIFIQCNGPVSCNIFSTNETVSSATTTTSSTETTTTTTTVAKTDSEIIAKSTVVKKQNENTQIYFDKFPPSHQSTQVNPSKSSEQQQNPVIFHRMDCQSPTNGHSSNKFSSSNMPIKRRILNSYAGDSPTVSTPHASSMLNNSSRCLYRSKSLNYMITSKKEHLRRSNSVPPTAFHLTSLIRTSSRKEQQMTNKSKTEPIDLTDGSYSMPMIVNVEENVAVNIQQQKINSKRASISNKPQTSSSMPISLNSNSESRVSPSVVSRSTSHPSDSLSVTKPIPIHPPTPSSYRPSPYVGYHQDSYHYRELNQTTAQSSSMSTHPYSHVTNNGNPYPYSYPSSAQYLSVKKSRESFSSSSSSVSNSFDTRSNPIHSTHPSISTNPNLSPNVVMPIVRKPNYYHQLTPEQQASIKMQPSSPATTPCRLPCCYPSHANIQTHSTEKSFGEERTIYRQYANALTPQVQTFKREPSQTPDVPNPLSSINRKQRRVEQIPPTSSTPYPYYPQGKSYFVPPQPPPSSSSSTSHWPPPPTPPSNPNMKPSIRYPYPPPSMTPMNSMPRKMEPYSQPRRPTPVPSRVPAPAPQPPSSTPVVVQNSSTLISPPNTPHELTLPNIRTRSIDLQRAIVERGCCDMDKLPKLVVRHSKTYVNRTIDTMGQLFPTWFNEPDYRCIHCFRCDQVFTPQQFMTHVDDELLQNEQPTSMTSIQLSTSEKMSEYKVGLWNQFCTNLTIYAREGRIGGFSTNRNV